MRIKQTISLSSFSIFMSAHSVFCYTTVFDKHWSDKKKYFPNQYGETNWKVCCNTTFFVIKKPRGCTVRWDD